MTNGTPSSIQTLIGDALRETNDLARKEIALFRNEMTSNVRSLFIGLALGLVLGGAVGNLIDRIMNPPAFGRGHVTDFLDAESATK